MKSGGYIYVIQVGRRKRVKVGITRRTPEERLADLQTSSLDKLNLRYSRHLPNPEAVEKRAHRKLSRFRLQGEWFNATVAEAIAAIEASVQTPRVTEEGIEPFSLRELGFSPLDAYVLLRDPDQPAIGPITAYIKKKYG